VNILSARQKTIRKTGFCRSVIAAIFPSFVRRGRICRQGDEYRIKRAHLQWIAVSLLKIFLADYQ